MLGCDLKLSADIIPYKLFKERIVLIKHKIVKAYPGSYEYFFHTPDCFDLLYKLKIFRVIYLQIFARCGRQTLSVCANAVFQLFIAGGITEICRRSADIMNISLEIRKRGNDLSLGNHALNAS